MKKLFISLVLAVLCMAGSTAATGLQKTYTWKYNINKDARITFSNYDCNLIIHTWDKAETEYHLTIDAKTRSDEDAAVLDNFIGNLKFSNSSSSVDYKDSFYESRNNIMGRTTMKLGNSKTISLTDFSLKGEVWIPAGCRFELDSKYSEVHFEDFAGVFFLRLYNGNLFAGSLKGKADIDDKYSTMEFKEMNDVKAVLYNSKLNASSMGNLEADSKYSKIVVPTVGNLIIVGYNDNYEFKKAGDLTLNAKYTDLKSDVAGKVVLDCYEGSVKITEAKNISIASKYADFQFGTAGDVTVSSSYNGKLESGKLNSLKITESKYCTYKVDDLVSSVTESDGYQDNFNIGKTGQEFRGFSIEGKYIEITLTLPKTTDYRFKARIQYANLNMNESQLKPKTKIVDGSNLQYDAIKGTEKDGMPLIEINGYEMGLKIVEM